MERWLEHLELAQNNSALNGKALPRLKQNTSEIKLATMEEVSALKLGERGKDEALVWFTSCWKTGYESGSESELLAVPGGGLEAALEPSMYAISTQP